MEKYFEKILVAFDNSKASRIALKKACNLAVKFNSKITAICVSNKKEEEAALDESKNYLYDFSTQNNIDIEMINRDGKVYSEVISLERERNFDLILIGAHSSSGWSPLWIGSNAFKVVSSSHCPVITIRDTVAEAPKLDYLMPLADSSNSRQKVPYTAAMAKAFGATVHILGVSKNDSDETEKYINVYINQAERYFAERGVKYTVTKRLGVKVPETCIEEAVSRDCGLITIMTETESSGLFMDSYSQQLINTSPIPVMSIHPRDTKVSGSVGY